MRRFATQTLITLFAITSVAHTANATDLEASVSIDSPNGLTFEPVAITLSLQNAGNSTARDVPPLQIRWGYTQLTLMTPDGSLIPIEKISDDPSYRKAGYTRGRTFRTLEPAEAFDYTATIAATWNGQPQLLFAQPGEYRFELSVLDAEGRVVADAASPTFTLRTGPDHEALTESLKTTAHVHHVLARAEQLDEDALRVAEEMTRRYANSPIGHQAEIAILNHKQTNATSDEELAAIDKHAAQLSRACWEGLRPQLHALRFQALKKLDSPRASIHAQRVKQQHSETEAVIAFVD